MEPFSCVDGHTLRTSVSIVSILVPLRSIISSKTSYILQQNFGPQICALKTSLFFGANFWTKHPTEKNHLEPDPTWPQWPAMNSRHPSHGWPPWNSTASWQLVAHQLVGKITKKYGSDPEFWWILVKNVEFCVFSGAMFLKCSLYTTRCFNICPTPTFRRYHVIHGCHQADSSPHHRAPNRRHLWFAVAWGGVRWRMFWARTILALYWGSVLIKYSKWAIGRFSATAASNLLAPGTL